MKNIIPTFFYLSLLLPLAGHAEILLIEDVIESEKLQLSLDSSLDGYVTAKRCPKCPSVRLKVNKNTQAFKHGKQVHLNQATQRNGKFATVIFDPKTKVVNRIKW